MQEVIKRINTAGNDFKGILKRIIKRDYSGYTGLAIKNSIFQFSTSLTGKIGSLFFTILLARILMPELFGLYSLALATIVIFTSLSDLGITSATIRFISNAMGKHKNSSARAYIQYLFKFKIILIIIAGFILLAISWPISHYYYNKPIFFALLAGIVYLFAYNLINFIDGIFNGLNQFKKPLVKEIVFQLLRLVLVPALALFSIKMAYSRDIITLNLIASITICYILILIFYARIVRKNLLSLSKKSKKLSHDEKSSIRGFIFNLSLLSLSGLIFGYIDMIILGHFVSASIIGHYSAALNLAGSIALLITFSTSLLPIFSRLNGTQLQVGFRKVLNLVVILSLIGFILSLTFAPLIIGIIYGINYTESINIFRLLAILLIVLPISALYESFFISQAKTKVIAKFLALSTLLNLVLNVFLVTYFLRYSESFAVFGASIAIIISRIFYLSSLFFNKRRIKTL